MRISHSQNGLLLFMSLLSVALFGCSQLFTAPNPEGAAKDQAAVVQKRVPEMFGICLVSGDSLDERCYQPIIDLGANYVQQVPFGSQRDPHSPEIRFDPKTIHLWGESDVGLIRIAELGHMGGVKTMLKPHIWCNTQDGKWRSDIRMLSEKDWGLWFQNYGDFILHYARVAEEGQMESLCIGTELHQTVKERPEEWRALIKEIRKVYSGKLTYAANFYQEYQDVTFWDDLDFIGIQGYFPLTENENPSLAELLVGWEKHVKVLEQFSTQYGKPIVFTEIGYKSTRDAAIRPWEWPSDRGEVLASDTSFVTQSTCFEALFQTFSDKDWMEGFFVWKWHSEHYARSAEYEAQRLERVAHSRATRPQIHFTPKGKPAEKVIRKWFYFWREPS